MSSSSAVISLQQSWSTMTVVAWVISTLVLVFALANLKNLPFVWHFRLFGFLFQKTRLRVPVKPTPELRTLFQPLIITTRSPWLELDIYMHKSNSTFFSDVDIARGHLIAALLWPGVRHYRDVASKSTKGKMLGVVLGGLGCSFKKEIKVYEKYEIWTRVLCWDEKWIYFVSHFVRKGKVQPGGYSLQPWRTTKKGRASKGEIRSTTTSPPQDALLASVVSKCVFKNGRITVPPERVLQAAGLLPARPEKFEARLDGALISDTEEALKPDGSTEEDMTQWTWATIEEERLKGMKVADSLNGLSSAHDAFDPEGPALAEYPDLFGLC